MAEEGDVDASMAAVAQAERLRADADKLAARYSQPDRFMEVCGAQAASLPGPPVPPRRLP